MKYTLILFLLLACRNSQQKVNPYRQSNDSSNEFKTVRDTIRIDSHDPFQTGKDTANLNNVLELIFNFPEVQAVNKQIEKNSGGKHGVSIITRDELGSDTAYYLFEVGDNSRDDRYVNIFNFVLEKKTGKIKVYDPVMDSILTLKAWRKTRQ